jgi:hypothetical protein
MGVINQLDDGFGISIGGGGSAPFVGLLDTYSGAEAAYSVRLLSSTYMGALVEIRKSPSNELKSFYPDTNNELSLSSEDGAGTSLSSWIGEDNGYVRTWYNQSGNANNVIQTSAAHQPQIVESGVVMTDNSKPTLYFNGSNYMQSASSFTLVPQPTTHFLVGKITGGLSARHFHDFTSYRQGFYNDLVAMYAGAALGSGVNVSTQRLVSGLFDSFSSQISVDGTIRNTGNAGTQGYAGILKIASYSSQPNNWMIGNIQSLIIYGTDRFTSDRVGIETNINDYYSIY